MHILFMHLIRKHEPQDCFQFDPFDVKTHTKIQKFSKHGDSEGTLNERITKRITVYQSI